MRIYFILAVLALTMTATVAVRVVFSLFALELGAGAFQVGLLSAANQLPALLLAIPVGVMGDRFGARWPMFVGALFGVVGVLLPYLFPSAPALFVGAALCGVWAVLILVLSQVVVGMLSPPQEMTRNYSRFAMAMSLTALAGPVIAGHAIEQLGHALACLVLVAFPVVIAALLLAWGGMLPPGERNFKSADTQRADASPRSLSENGCHPRPTAQNH